MKKHFTKFDNEIHDIIFSETSPVLPADSTGIALLLTPASMAEICTPLVLALCMVRT